MRPTAENRIPEARAQAGFSLLELVIAVSILVMMTGALSPALVRYIEKGRERRDQQSIIMLYDAVNGALYDETAYDAIKSGLKDNGVYSAPIAVSTLFLQEDNFAGAVRDYIPTAPVLTSREAMGRKKDAEIMLYLAEEIDRTSGIRMMRVCVWAGSDTTCTGRDYVCGILPDGIRVNEQELPEEEDAIVPASDGDAADTEQGENG